MEGGGMEREGVEGRKGWRGGRDGGEGGIEGREGWRGGRDGGEGGMERREGWRGGRDGGEQTITPQATSEKPGSQFRLMYTMTLDTHTS